MYGEIEFDCGHWSVFENAIDMAHIHYLHDDSFGNKVHPPSPMSCHARVQVMQLMLLWPASCLAHSHRTAMKSTIRTHDSRIVKCRVWA